jgi:hypothetical protein
MLLQSHDGRPRFMTTVQKNDGKFPRYHAVCADVYARAAS